MSMKRGSLILLTVVITFVLTLCLIYFSLTRVSKSINKDFFAQDKKTFLFLHEEKRVKNPKKTVNVLVVSGGGVMGVIPLTILQYIEKRSGVKISDSFDLFAGTSTGALISSGLAFDRIVDGKAQSPSVTYVTDQYFNFAHTIFKQSFSHRIKTFFGLLGPRFEHAPLAHSLEMRFKQMSLSDVKRPLLFPSFDLENTSVIEFGSWKKNAPYAKTPIYKLLLGATSAPTAFPPYKITFTGQKQHNILVDGGLVANTPGLMAYFAARKLYPNSNIRIISIGDGSYKDILTPRRSSIGSMGLLAWGHILINVFIHSHALLSQQYLEGLIREPGSHLVDYYRINMSIPAKDYGVFDGSRSHLLYLQRMGRKYTHREKKQLDELAIKLQQKD
ncbi:MAG: patatin-like phospholipase family protein [Gammaproteobacteria bacterium]|nr:patatin-like phospholipase family protein [Gammaproteobacteria bacterium]MCH9743559.1 patatin-like phospholipase family protein [Gammaproteobacteria bacterium]